jgi:hypothetical protein
VDLAEFRKALAGDSKLLNVLFSMYVADPAVMRAYQQASGKGHQDNKDNKDSKDGELALGCPCRDGSGRAPSGSGPGVNGSKLGTDR